MNKPVVVILHGWNLSAERFRPLAAELTRRGYRVAAPDFPGFGREPAPKQAWHVADYAAFLHSYLRNKKIHRPILVGHSFGGRVALVYAQTHPEAVGGVILTGTPGFTPTAKPKVVLFRLIAKIGGALFALPPLSFFASRAKRLLYRAAGSGEYLRAQGSMQQTFKYVVEDDLTAAMESLSVPCMLLWGEEDTMVPVGIAKKMAAVIPGAQLSLIAGADHGVPFRRSDVFVNRIEHFVATL